MKRPGQRFRKTHDAEFDEMRQTFNEPARREWAVGDQLEELLTVLKPTLNLFKHAIECVFGVFEGV
jgi:hypothetical protein